MGVSTNFYTVYGVKTEWNDEFHEAYDDVYNDEDTPNVIADGMSGEYIVLGIVLYDSGDMRWGFEKGDSFKEVELETLSNMERQYKSQFTAKFPQFSHLLDTTFKLMTFAHYS